MSLMPRLLACVVAAGAIVDSGLGAAPPDRWADETARVVEQARALGASVTAESIGRSIEGRDLTVVRVRGQAAAGGAGGARGERGAGATDARRPTLLIVAGLDGRHVAGTRLAIKLIERLAADQPRALAHADIAVIPCVNPDAMARFFDSRPRVDDGANAARRTTARDDADRDRRMDEDGPVDIDGDGLITQMRVRRPRPGLLRDFVATEITESDAPRLMRRADAAKGETAEYAVVVEGTDQDGDGLLGEDGPVGVDLDSNFPYHWPEFNGRAGPTPLSEPETRSLADWVLLHPEIVAILVYGPGDNLVSVPVGGKFDQTGEVPISGGVLDADRPTFEFAAKQFKEATGITGTGGAGGGTSFDGSFVGWAYAHLGIASFTTPGWVRPDLVKPEERKPLAKAEAAEAPLATSPVGDVTPPKPAPAAADEAKPARNDDAKKDDKKKPLETEDAKWLVFSDSQPEGRRGFIEWRPFDHPQLGPVEIGGWVPGFRLNGPADADSIDPLASDHRQFVAELLADLPTLVADPPRVEAVGQRGGTWRIAMSAVNTGRMPTRTAMGVKARRLPPTRWEIGVEPSRILSGRRVQGVPAVAAGASIVAEWVITGDPGAAVSIKLLAPETGDQEIVVKLESTNPGEPGRQEVK